MGFRINTNVAALSAHANASMNNRAIDSSLSKLNSGFRINSAADDASGMAIADSLRSQASSLGKAIMNANDAIGIIQTADKAMDEQIKILETIKNKAIQSAQDGQTTETRKALQADISRLMEELDNIGNTTSFNGQKLLSGTFSNKEFQIGAYSNETVKASIGATTSDKIGLTRFETGHNVRQSDLTGTATVTFKNVDGINDVTLEPVKLTNEKGDISATTGLGALAEAINKASDKTGIKASVTAISTFEQPIKAGTTTSGFSINGVQIGTVDVKDKDANGALRAAINAVKDQTGVEASVDAKGRLVLANRDGRGIKVEDNIQGSVPAKDFHNLVTQGAAGQENVKKAVDLNVAATWTTAAGQTGSIYNKNNSFADLKNAHGVQDAAIAKDAFNAVKDEALVAKAANDIDKAKNTALEKLKKDLSESLTNFANGLADNGNDTASFDKAKATILAQANVIENANSFDAISTALTSINTDTDVGKLDTNSAAKTVEAFQKLAAGQVKTYVESINDASANAKLMLADNKVDLTKGSAQTFTAQLNALDTGITAALTGNNNLGHATAATAFGAIAAFATVDDTYSTHADVTALVGKDAVLTGLAIPDDKGVLQLVANGQKFEISDTSADADMKALNEMITNLRAQTTKEGVNDSLKKIDDKLTKLIDNAEGKAMNTDEAQKGLVAHALKKFFTSVKSGVNEPTAKGMGSIVGMNAENSTNMGRLSLVANNGRDIQVEVKDAGGFIANSALGFDKNVSEKTVSLRETNAKIDKEVADAMGFNNEEWQAGDNGDNQNGYAAGVMTLKGAQAMMNIAETAQKALEAIRSDLGSVQNQLVSTVNNISVTQVNVKAAESNIRDVDFAEESATFSKHQILAQSGVYAMSQANAVQQNVMRLLQ